MIKIHKKRKYAYILDVAFYIVLLTIVSCFIRSLLFHKDFLFYILLFYPINFRDFLFKGASIGKKIMGIRIYDKNWRTPSYSLLLRRSIYTLYLYFEKHPRIVTLESLEITELDIIDAEREKFGTRVVDNKVFKRLSEEAKLKEGRWEDNMSKMYDEYIMCVYSK